MENEESTSANTCTASQHSMHICVVYVPAFDMFVYHSHHSEKKSLYAYSLQVNFV